MQIFLRNHYQKRLQNMIDLGIIKIFPVKIIKSLSFEYFIQHLEVCFVSVVMLFTNKGEEPLGYV